MANTENWFVVYDIRDTLPWVEMCILLITLVFAVGGPVAVLKLSQSAFVMKLASPQTRVPRRVYRLKAGWFAFVGCVLTVGFGYNLYHSLFLRGEDAFRTASIATGTVSAVEPVRRQGDTVMSEQFHVGEERFVVHNNRLGSGLMRLAAEGGPCRSGRCVRITYIGEAILRVEAIDE